MTFLLPRPSRFLGLAAASLTALTLLASTPAHAQMSFSFVNDTLPGVENQAALLTFQLNLASGPLESFINGLIVQFDGNVLPANLIDTSPFVNNVTIPDPLPGNYAAPNLDFFTVSLGGVGPGTYTGFASFIYTTDGLTEETVTNPFAVNVAVAPDAPEPTSLALISLVGIGIVARRRARCKSYSGQVI